MGYLIFGLIYLAWMAFVVIWELFWLLVKCVIFVLGSLMGQKMRYPWYRWL